MLEKVYKSIACCITLTLINMALFGCPKDEVVDTVVGKILFGTEEFDDVIIVEPIPTFQDKEEIVQIDLEAYMGMGIKRKSYIVGQIFDYVRFSDLSTQMSMKMSRNSEDLNITTNNYNLNLNITLIETKRLISKKQKELNFNKCGDSNCVCLFLSVNSEDVEIKNKYFAINTRESIGRLDVDSHQFNVESSIYLNITHDSDSSKIEMNSKVNIISFNLFIKEILTSTERDSTSEIQINSDIFFNYTNYIFILFFMIIEMGLIGDLMIYSNLIKLNESLFKRPSMLNIFYL